MWPTSIFIFPGKGGRTPSVLLMRKLGFRISDAVQPSSDQEEQKIASQPEDDADLHEEIRREKRLKEKEPPKDE
jgi:hypothetical protein